MGSNPSVSAKNFKHLACLGKCENAALLPLAATVLAGELQAAQGFP